MKRGNTAEDFLNKVSSSKAKCLIETGRMGRLYKIVSPFFCWIGPTNPTYSSGFLVHMEGWKNQSEKSQGTNSPFVRIRKCGFLTTRPSPAAATFSRCILLYSVVFWFNSWAQRVILASQNLAQSIRIKDLFVNVGSVCKDCYLKRWVTQTEKFCLNTVSDHLLMSWSFWHIVSIPSELLLHTSRVSCIAIPLVDFVFITSLLEHTF